MDDATARDVADDGALGDDIRSAGDGRIATELRRGSTSAIAVRNGNPPSFNADPILIVLHQKHSLPGRVGHWLRDRGYRLDIRRVALGDPLPDTLAHHTGAVIYGGPMSANDPDDFIKAEIDFCGVALAEEKPFLGICLGAQMLAKHLGGEVGPHPDGMVEVGYYPITPTDQGRQAAQGWVGGGDSATHTAPCPWPSHFYQWHREGFTLPSGAELLASTGTYENQMFRYGPTAYGVQFHAEITYHLVNRWTLGASHRLVLPGARPRVEHLHGHHRHTGNVGRWLDAFLPAWLAGGASASARPHVERTQAQSPTVG